jgi:hypothetical protein
MDESAQKPLKAKPKQTSPNTPHIHFPITAEIFIFSSPSYPGFSRL